LLLYFNALTISAARPGWKVFFFVVGWGWGVKKRIDSAIGASEDLGGGVLKTLSFIIKIIQ
jgi:hypothetical protein